VQRWRLLPGNYHVTAQLGVAYFDSCDSPPRWVTPLKARQNFQIDPATPPGFYAIVQHPTGKNEPGWMPGIYQKKAKIRQ